MAEVETGLDTKRINELMAAVAARRDIDSYELLYRHFVPKVRSYMFKIGADRALAEELAQEALLSVWKKADLDLTRLNQRRIWKYMSTEVRLCPKSIMTYMISIRAAVNFATDPQVVTIDEEESEIQLLDKPVTVSVIKKK